MNQVESLFRSLNDAEIRYLVIGATAFAAHGWVRATADVDLFVERDAKNIERLREALMSFGYDVTDASVDDFQQYKILLRQYDLPLDIHPFVKGSLDFAGAWGRRVVQRFGEVEVPFASLEDLIVMKEAANRPKDLQDLEQLRKLLAARNQP